jgi:hypothetical protein
MSKYIPKVGEAFESKTTSGSDWFKCGKVLAQTDKQIVYLKIDGFAAILHKDHYFRPIATKADVEREQLIHILNSEYGTNKAVFSIQQAGFTIHKKVKRSDIGNTIALNLDSSYEIRRGITKAICSLLGDLVEQEDKGGEL